MKKLEGAESTDAIYECIYSVDVSYQAFGPHGPIYSGNGRLRPGQRVGLYPPNKYFTGIDRQAITAVPDPSIAFEQNWVPDAIRREAGFNGVILYISTKDLGEHFKLIEGQMLSNNSLERS